MDPHADQDHPQPSRPFHGCLWGCVGTLIAVTAVIAGVYVFGAHYFSSKLGSDVHVQEIMAAVNRSDEARSVLGRNITARSREAQTYSYETGRGGTASYVLKVIGSNGEGEVAADLDITGAKTRIKSLVLTDSEGHAHYLIGAAPPNPMMQNSI